MRESVIMDTFLFGMSIAGLCSIAFLLSFVWESRSYCKTETFLAAAIISIAAGLILQCITTLLVFVGFVDPDLTYVGHLRSSGALTPASVVTNVIGPVVLAGIYAYVPSLVLKQAKSEWLFGEVGRGFSAHR